MSTEYPDGHPEPPRSSHWPAVEHGFLAAHPHCECCSASEAPKAKMQVHHRIPFHYAVALGRPDLELDPRNLITLCETTAGDPAPNHHLLLGHLGNFKSDNLHVSEDVDTFAGMTHDQIINDPRWLARKAARLKPLDQMDDDDKQALRALMDKLYPLENEP